jgi:hypothetical protein
MALSPQEERPAHNRLLAALPPEEDAQLRPHREGKQNLARVAVVRRGQEPSEGRVWLSPLERRSVLFQ